MFRLSRKTDYALLIVTALARRERAFVSVRSLARDYLLPYRFTAQIVGLLVRGAILESHEGVKGGIRLRRDPKVITVADILRATEGNIALTACLNAKGHFSCPQKAVCGAKHGMGMLQRRLLQSLGEMTVADFLRENEHARP